MKYRNLFLITMLAIVLNAIPTILYGQTYDDPEIKRKADAIHAKVLTLDTHADVPFYVTKTPGFDISKRNDPHKTNSRVDLPRMREGGMDAMFFVVYVPQGKRTPEGNAKAIQAASDRFDWIESVIEKHGDQVGLARSPEEAKKLKDAGKRAIFIGVENGNTIGNDLSLLQRYYDRGARYLTLSHIRNNDICDSSTDPKGAEHGGLSEFGKQVVKEMNRIGMVIDVSHISDEAFYDCLKYSKAPIAATHSSARALYDHPRNLSDDMIKALAKKGGVVQMNMLGAYLKDINSPERKKALAKLNEKYPNRSKLTKEQTKQRASELVAINKQHPAGMATLQEVMDHIDHIVRLVGVDHVGIGPDLDGGGGVKGMYDVSEMGNITYELVKRGYSEEDIAKIWSGNFFRVMKAAETVAKR